MNVINPGADVEVTIPIGDDTCAIYLGTVARVSQDGLHFTDGSFYTFHRNYRFRLVPRVTIPDTLAELDPS